MKGLIIGGTHSGCGKTTVSLAILAGLKKKGFNVQPFKAGPDYIDPGLHKLVSGRPSINLDPWMMGRKAIRWSFHVSAEGADMAVVEGVMGLFDGGRATAELSRILDLPVVLVIDAGAMAESVGALVLGYRQYFQRLYGTDGPGIKGVILNRVGSDRHLKMLKGAITDVEVLGYLPKAVEISIEERHLGLKTADEAPLTDQQIERLAEIASNNINMDRLIEISDRGATSDTEGLSLKGRPLAGVQIGYARDRAFCFYYEDNLRILELAGAELRPFSPLKDPSPPDADMYYLGGGYPELYATALSENTSMLSAIKGLVEEARPVYAECGGFMYLCSGLYSMDNRFYPMTGVFPFITEMTPRRTALGYREVTLRQDTPIGLAGDVLRGHEFHYSDLRQRPGETKTVYDLKDRWGRTLSREGYLYKNCLGSYVHLHFLSNPGAVLRAIETATRTRK